MAGLVLALVLLAAPLRAQTIEQFLSAPEAMDLAVAKKADRVAWMTWERGMRNVYTAAAPSFTPVRLTSFLKDDGQELSNVQLSDDGHLAIFVRGSAPNREGWIANPTHDPAGAERMIWATSTNGSGAWPLVAGTTPELSPDGRTVVYVKNNQIFRVRTTRGVAQDSMDRGLKPFINEWGQQSNPMWSPDGSKLAFVSSRGDHSFIGIYDVAKRNVVFAAPSVDCDMSPTWSPDSKRIAFIRKPGAPFSFKAPPDRNACAAMHGFRGNGPADSTTFADGSNTKVIVVDVARLNADIASDAGTEIWHNAPKDPVFNNVALIIWADADHIIFPFSPPKDEWDRYYSLSVSQPGAPVLLTTTDGLIEDNTSATLSRDRATLYYSTNANDIERRHIWAVPVAGGTPREISRGDGAETSPASLSNDVAVLYFGARQPASVALVKNGTPKIIFPVREPASFPMSRHVVPQIVVVKAPDSLDVHTQLFLPANLKPGEKRPAIVFVHGGPMREMMPTYHYMQFYHWAYGINQYLASKGYVVISVNYRLGIGYGRSFRTANNKGGATGNAEYQDVLAAAKYLQTRPDVDANRIGIWGLSYGGLLTAQALARNSDVFKAGVDMAGVHLWGNSLDTAAVSYKSSPISEVDHWKSPVLLVQGDDDRNVQFSQMVGLVPLLRAHGVPHELIIIPDDTHESLLYSRWRYIWHRMDQFLERYLPL